MASPLPSTTSAAGHPALFGGFSGSMEPSDFPRPFVIGVCPWTSRCGLRFLEPQTGAGSPGSRAGCLHACTGSLTARGPSASRDIDASGVAFRLLRRRRHPGVGHGFRGSIPDLHVPLSTLRPPPRGGRRMTRGRCGSLRLHRTTLAFATPRRFDRRTGGPQCPPKPPLPRGWKRRVRSSVLHILALSHYSFTVLAILLRTTAGNAVAERPQSAGIR